MTESDIRAFERKNFATIAAFALGAVTLGGALYWFVGDKETPKAEQQPIVEAAPVAPAPEVKMAPAPSKLAHFAYNDASLDSDAKKMLDTWSELLVSQKGMEVTIEGHCDERGSEAYNQRLGQRRAEAAKAYLVGKGIAAQRLKTVSYGESQPASSGKGESVWAENRRIELRSVMALSRN